MPVHTELRSVWSLFVFFFCHAGGVIWVQATRQKKLHWEQPLKQTRVQNRWEVEWWQGPTLGGVNSGVGAD